MRKFITQVIVPTMITGIMLFALVGCTEVEKVNNKIGNNADNFELMRKITVYNTRTNQFLVELTGNFSLQNNSNKELEIICKVGEDQYKKNFIYLNDDVGYIVEEVTGDNDFNKYYYNMEYFNY